MKATGIIVEYNPFHNGHRLHATLAKKENHADLIIAVMSGHFLQRGEPAFIDKWSRTEMALKNGVDLVFELPYAFATSHAPEFAKGAVTLLDAACCDTYCFGSEEGRITSFTNSLALLHECRTDYEQFIADAVSKGNSYPKALNIAYEQAIAENQMKGDFADLTQPNNILGFQYMKAAKEIQSSMKATTIQRVGAAYHEEKLTPREIGSATGIRKNFFNTKQLDAVENFMPPTVFNLLKKHSADGFSFGNWERFYPFLRMMILRDGPEKLKEIADVTEGIENLFYRAAFTQDCFESFMQMVKSKRYTWTRIQRMLTHIFTGYTYEHRKNIEAPSYLRLLGMTENGRAYLNKQKKNFKLPIVSKVSASSDPSLAIDIHATNMYALGSNTTHMMNADFKRVPIFLRH